MVLNTVLNLIKRQGVVIFKGSKVQKDFYDMKWGILLICVCLSVCVQAKKLHVAFLVPELGTSAFWDRMLTPLPTVAEQFDIHITFHHADFRDRFDYYPQAKMLLEREEKPDFLIAALRGASAKPLLDLVELHQVPLVTISSGVPLREREFIGYPQQRYKYWRAQVLGDDEGAGFTLAQQLLVKANQFKQKQDEPKTFSMIAIGGDLVLETSHQKNRGLKQALKMFQEIELLQLVHADWNEYIAMRMTEQLHNRYGDIDLIWAANDDIALGAYQATLHFENHQNKPLIAGIDWTKRGLLAVTEGKLAFSLGGNHMQAVWALILVHDLAQGFDDTGFEYNTFRIPLLMADQGNVDIIRTYIESEGYKTVDFKQFSKRYNTGLQRYQFDLNTLIFEQ